MVRVGLYLQRSPIREVSSGGRYLALRRHGYTCNFPTPLRKMMKFGGSQSDRGDMYMCTYTLLYLLHVLI